MKFSPHYKVFEEEAVSWYDKLNRVQNLFDVWIDVQRQWVYLEGIFSGNADMKHLLPVESARFSNINSEFMSAMKKVYKSPFVHDVINIPNIQKSLERLGELLQKIQKALGEYLERERNSFSRFYFVGDEDLLEIIGNSNEISRLQKHFTKMFSGVSSVVLSAEGDIIGVTSPEDERVMLQKPVSLQEKKKINTWLSELDIQLKQSLSQYVREALVASSKFIGDLNNIGDYSLTWIERFPAQVITLVAQIQWTAFTEKSFTGSENTSLPKLLDFIDGWLKELAKTVLLSLKPLTRKKCENLITELVRQRDTTKAMMSSSINDDASFDWLRQMRFYHNNNAELGHDVTVKMANAVFEYGFEYLGAPDKLVHTPLTDKCYLTLTQALSSRLGGSPFGPAGTGKTESVKALGAQLGRFVLVFNCDDTFDFQAMGRIFVGICTVGAWGCFDEFNRLEERILSAVSQQIQTIQLGLKKLSSSAPPDLNLIGKKVTLNPQTGEII
jgi:dynein heavy chain 1